MLQETYQFQILNQPTGDGASMTHLFPLGRLLIFIESKEILNVVSYVNSTFLFFDIFYKYDQHGGLTLQYKEKLRKKLNIPMSDPCI